MSGNLSRSAGSELLPEPIGLRAEIVSGSGRVGIRVGTKLSTGLAGLLRTAGDLRGIWCGLVTGGKGAGSGEGAGVFDTASNSGIDAFSTPSDSSTSSGGGRGLN
jgi:hypothetical protein